MSFFWWAGALSSNVSAVPEPGRGVVGAFGWVRPGWVEGSAATKARNGLLAEGASGGAALGICIQGINRAHAIAFGIYVF